MGVPDFVPLDQQAIDALSKPCSSANAAAVLALAEEALAGLNAQAIASDQASLSPLASHAKAVQLRREAGEYRFEADRMDATVTALRARVTELVTGERRAAAEAERSAAVAERDALAADIARDYPRLVYELTTLVQRIVASDQRCEMAGVRESAEALGRGIPRHFRLPIGSPILRLQDAQIPMPGSDRLAWEQVSMLDAGLTFRGLTLAPSAYAEAEKS